MAIKDLSFWDYVKAAFNLRVRMPGLGHMPLNKLLLAAFGILGVGHPGFWFLGMGYETAYILFLTGSERFQRVAQGRALEESRLGWNRNVRDVLSKLDPESQTRYNQLLVLCWQIEHSGQKASLLSSVHEFKIEGLNQLLRIFIRLLESQSNVREIISKTSHGELEKDIQQLKKLIKINL